MSGKHNKPQNKRIESPCLIKAYLAWLGYIPFGMMRIKSSFLRPSLPPMRMVICQKYMTECLSYCSEAEAKIWLDPSHKDLDFLQQLLKPFKDTLNIYPVSSKVNDSSYDEKDVTYESKPIIEPFI